MAKAMRAMKAMRAAMRAMKAKKRVSKIARGKFSRSVVFRGNKDKTVGGLKKADLIKSKSPEVRREKDEGRDEVVRAPGRGDFCALSKDGLACLLRGSDLMYASFSTR